MEKKERRLRLFGAIYLFFAVLALGYVLTLCYPEAVFTVRSYLSGRTAEAFAELSGALGGGEDVRAVFGRLTP